MPYKQALKVPEVDNEELKKISNPTHAEMYKIRQLKTKQIMLRLSYKDDIDILEYIYDNTKVINITEFLKESLRLNIREKKKQQSEK